MESIEEDVKIPLKAIDKNDALIEAKAIWENISAEANARWEKQKKTYMHPPITAFDGASPNPRVIYEIFI